jgi:hypothetical protein
MSSTFLFTKMRDIFRVPPPPFQLGKSSFHNAIVQPIKVNPRRLSNTSRNQPAKPFITGNKTGEDEVIRESEPEDENAVSYNTRDTSDKHNQVEVTAIVERMGNGARNRVLEKENTLETDSSNSMVQDSFSANKDADGDIIRDSFVEMKDNGMSSHDKTTRIIMPLTTKKRRRSSEEHKKSKSRKKSHKPELSGLAEEDEHLMSKKKKKSRGTNTAKAHEITIDLERRPTSTTSLSKSERKEHRRRERRKAEQQKGKAERKKEIQEMRDTSYRTIPNTRQINESVIYDSARQGQESPSQNVDNSSLRKSLNLETYEEEPIPQSTSMTKNGGPDLEIPARKEVQSHEQIPETLSVSEPEPELEQNPNYVSPKPAAKPLLSKNRVAKPVVSRASRRTNTKKRAPISNEKIVDSEAEEDAPQETKPHEIEPPIRRKRRKISGLESLRTPQVGTNQVNRDSTVFSHSDASEERETSVTSVKSIAKKFSEEEDKRLHRIVAFYKKVPTPSCWRLIF